MPLHQILQWEKEIREITRRFRETFAGLTHEAINWKPNPEIWSIGQNVDHLITVNETYKSVIQAHRNGQYQLPFLGRFAFVTRFFGNLILKSVSPERKKKIKTFPVWEPSGSHIDTHILTRFAQHQEQLIVLMKGCEDLLSKQIVISSPANKHIVYTLEKAFEIIIAHEKRHFQQAKGILELMPKSSSGNKALP